MVIPGLKSLIRAVYVHIGIIGPVGGDEFGENIADALRGMGHEVTQLGPAHPARRNRRMHDLTMLTRMTLYSYDEKAQRRIAKKALGVGCELVINDDLRLMPATVEELKRGGVRVVFWTPDAVSHLGRQLMLLAPYDALFFKEPHTVDRVRANLGIPAYYLPEACNPRWHRPLVPAGTEPHLVIAGSMYPYRVRIIERLVAKGIPVKMYGIGIPKWIRGTPVRTMHTGITILREEKAKVFRQAVGALNTMDPAEVAGVNNRLFESAGCGAAVLTEFRPALPDLFDIGEEVLAYHDFDELVDQAARLFNEPDLSTRLGDAAAKRAHADHTYERRLANLLEQVL